MELNLSPILNYDGKKMHICEAVSLSALPGDRFEIISPVNFDGYAQNIGGTIEICGSSSAELKLTCDRCMDEFSTHIDFSVNEKYRKHDDISDTEENPDITPFSGTSLNFDEILYSNLYMNLPSKFLCKDDCKGLCPVCGQNLNIKECDCNTETTDPRFDILDKLL